MGFSYITKNPHILFHTFHQTPSVYTLVHEFHMDHKLNKGKGVMGLSSTALVSALSLIHTSCVNEFEKNFKSQIVMKQHVYESKVVAHLHILEIIHLME